MLRTTRADPSPRRGEVESAQADRVRGGSLSGERQVPSPCPLPTGERVPTEATKPTNKDARIARARRLRRSQTDAERLLWSRLRDRRLCGWKFRRQVPIGRYIVDFCCPDAWLVVELDGGGHTSEGTAAYDARRTQEIEAASYLLIRFWNREVIENLDGVCDTILAQVEAKA